nr:type II secretion system protein GspE [Synergistales bacterium]
SRLLGNVLVNHGLITEEQLEAALAEQKLNRKRLGDILVDNGWICERELTQGISKQLLIPIWK